MKRKREPRRCSSRAWGNAPLAHCVVESFAPAAPTLSSETISRMRLREPRRCVSRSLACVTNVCQDWVGGDLHY